VNHSGGFDTLHMCEEARSLAVDGMTIEAKQTRDDAAKADAAKQEAAWRAAHPPREPKDDMERADVVKAPFHFGGMYGNSHVCGAKICDDPGMTPWSSGLTTYVTDQNSIKVAECVIVPEGK
jgi:hypothetical protein